MTGSMRQRATFAILHLLEAVDTDFADVLEKKNARVNFVKSFANSNRHKTRCTALTILNGGGFGVLANHSLVMASHISRANAAMSDLRQLLNRAKARLSAARITRPSIPYFLTILTLYARGPPQINLDRDSI